MANDLAIVSSSPANHPASPTADDLVGMFLAGRNPRTMAAYGRDFDDFARFLGSPDRRSAIEALLSAGQGGANARALGLADAVPRGAAVPHTPAANRHGLRLSLDCMAVKNTFVIFTRAATDGKDRGERYLYPDRCRTP
jgi:hypothetical protein